jgi:hypothetical protein
LYREKIATYQIVCQALAIKPSLCEQQSKGRFLASRRGSVVDKDSKNLITDSHWNFDAKKANAFLFKGNLEL